MLKEDVIKPVMSKWASSVVFAPKNDGKFRFCVYYRKLNAMTIRGTYPLLQVDEFLDSLGDATIFSKTGCNSGYWQIKILEAARHKIIYFSHRRLVLLIRVPFGRKRCVGIVSAGGRHYNVKG